MSLWKKIVVVVCLLSLLLPAVGCKGEGEAEKAGKKIDSAVDAAKEKAKKLLE